MPIRLPQSWVGLTIFYEDRPSGDEVKTVYADTLDGLCELRLATEEIADVRAVYEEWKRPWSVYALILKKSAKESTVF